MNPQKIGGMLGYLVKSDRPIPRAQLYKRLYLADWLHTIKQGRSISGCTYLKYPLGPVPQGLNNLLTLLAREAVVVELVEDMEEFNPDCPLGILRRLEAS